MKKYILVFGLCASLSLKGQDTTSTPTLHSDKQMKTEETIEDNKKENTEKEKTGAILAIIAGVTILSIFLYNARTD